MSYLTEQELMCPYCKHPFHAEIWSSVNVKLDPELKDILLGGELNMVECEACRKIFYSENFLLYHDPENELMAFVYPYSYRDEREKWEEKTRNDFKDTQHSANQDQKISYEPLSLFGLDELVRLVENEEEVAIQSEIAAFLSKENGFHIRTIKPSLARRQKLPRSLPFLKDPDVPDRESLLAALANLTKINDRLHIYNEARKMLVDNATFSIQFAE